MSKIDYASEFKRLQRMREPYQNKWTRMYYLYRAFRHITDEKKRKYLSQHLPPIGYQIIETIKPRIAALKLQVKFYNITQETAEELLEWDNLINWQLQTDNFENKKIEWVHNTLLYGDGFILVRWDSKHNRPTVEVLDNYTLYIDPSVSKIQNARYIIRQTFKKKSQITTVPQEVLDKIDIAENVQVNDPRKDRTEIETLRMGGDKDTMPDDEPLTTTEEEPTVEVREVFDFENKERIVYIQNEEVYREPTAIEARHFIQLKAIAQPHTLYSMSILEPVESMIYLIADNRNQAFLNMALTNNPIVKKRKGANISNEDIVMEPAAVWELERNDDIVLERPPEISKQWVEQDKLLYNEIENTLALSEYMRGAPASSTEPMGKVELLLMQSNIRLSLLVRQLEEAIADLVEAMVDLNKKYLDISRAQVFFNQGKLNIVQMTEEIKNKPLIADIQIDTKPEKTTAVRQKEAIELWKMFVEGNQPQTPEEQEKLRKIKNMLMRAILEEFDKDAYAKLLEIEEKKQEQQEQPQEQINVNPPAEPIAAPMAPQAGFMQALQQAGKQLVGL